MKIVVYIHQPVFGQYWEERVILRVTTYLRRRDTEVKVGANEDIVNWTFALDLYKKWCRTVPGKIFVVLGLPWSIAALISFKDPFFSICCNALVKYAKLGMNSLADIPRRMHHAFLSDQRNSPYPG